MSREGTGIETSQNDSSSPKRLSRFTSNTSWRNLALAIVLRQLQSGCGEESSSCSATVAAVDESVSTDTCSHTHLSLDPLWGIRDYHHRVSALCGECSSKKQFYPVMFSSL